MNCLFVVVLAGCVALASSSVLRSTGGRTYQNKQQDGMKHQGTDGRIELTRVGQYSRIKQDQEGVDSRFNGPQPKGGVIQYNFKPDFDTIINPRNADADWRWAVSSVAQEVIFNASTFLRDARNTVDLIALPFKTFLRQDDTRVPPINDEYEGLIVNKQNITVGPNQELVVNLKFACKTFNTEDHPMPVEAVSKPEDDPTLANCGFAIGSYDKSALVFSIVATNNGLWAVYARNKFELLSHPERNHKEFTVLHRLVDRQSPYDLIDATIKYDRAQGKVDFIVDGEVQYTLSDLGTLNNFVSGNEMDKAYEKVYTINREDLVRVEPKNFQVYIGVGSLPDTADPNSPANPPLRGSKLTTDPNYYDNKAKFYDNAGLIDNVYFGQGASMTLHSIKIKLQPAGSDHSTSSIVSQVERRPRIQEETEEGSE